MSTADDRAETDGHAGEASRLPVASAVDERIERLVRRVLTAGLGLSAFLLSTGFIIWAVRGGDMPATVQGPLNAARSLIALDPIGLFSCGLLVLILTPFVRVAGSIVVFLREHDWRFAAVTGLVLVSMGAGLLVGSL
ncbi:MAG: DUF1634 domain-containing protein [Actinobacteria bacterium]|nr:DUF1634 domain-containing protein [Actinomycetota bacterium]